VIVRAAGPVLHLITQPDHAALARRIMDFWVAGDFPNAPRRASILHAVAEHDNGWREPDAAPIVDTAGAILDFITAPLEVRQGIWPRGVSRLAADPWAAALVAEHAVFIYSRWRGHPDWTNFFAEMESLRDRFVAAASLALDDLQRDYFFLRVADLMSLSFCNAWTDVQEIGGYRIRMNGDAVVVDPDPFGERTVPLEIGARKLPRRTWTTREAATAFATAPRVEVKGTLMGQ
jgi:Protein of unknown function (DUF3891)